MKVFKYAILLFSVLSALGILPVYAHAYKYTDTNSILSDTSYKNSNIHSAIWLNYISEPKNITDDSIEYELLNSGNDYFRNTINRRALLHFLKSVKLKNASRDRKLAYKLNYRLAKIFVRMKSYPLAMQYYFKTLQPSGEDKLRDDNTEIPNADNFEDPASVNFLSFSYQDTCLQVREVFFTNQRDAGNNSEPVSNSSITASFNDGKKSVAYAVIIHVKQPVSGKRKAFTGLNNVGHMFITLVKYNADSSCVSRSFGFYPEKNNLLSATPLIPFSSSVFKDDAFHDWDEAIGKFISRKRFERIIRLVTHYENRKYNLSKNNCTDFGLNAADVAGITIRDTRGNWPLGHGNNPANAGQSILEGQFLNVDTGNIQGLFICADTLNK